MSDLLQKSITVRGKSYTVSEMDAGTAKDIRKLTADEAHGMDMLVAERCCLTPKFTAETIAKLPNFVVKQISKAALALGAEEAGEKKADAPGDV